MKTDLTWNEFCELYFETARNYAGFHISRLVKKGAPDKRIDLDYVKDAAVLHALDKAYAHFDSTRGARITTYLSTLVHNEVVDEFNRELKRTAAQEYVDEVKTVIRMVKKGILEDEEENTANARVKLIPRLLAAIGNLSPSDQVILNYYLEDKSTYIARSVEVLHVRENYVSVRRNRVFALLPKLMEMTRSEYMRFCYEGSGTLNSSDNLILYNAVNKNNITIEHVLRPNPILPSLNLDVMAERLAGQLFAG